MLGSPHTALRATGLRQMCNSVCRGSCLSSDRVGGRSGQGRQWCRYGLGGGEIWSCQRQVPCASVWHRRLSQQHGDANDRGDGLVQLNLGPAWRASPPWLLPGVAHGRVAVRGELDGGAGGVLWALRRLVVEWWSRP